MTKGCGGKGLNQSIAIARSGVEVWHAAYIGPEGDFSPNEASLAVECGFIPVHLGPSRLRTETAAVTAVTACYLHFLEK